MVHIIGTQHTQKLMVTAINKYCPYLWWS